MDRRLLRQYFSCFLNAKNNCFSPFLILAAGSESEFTVFISNIKLAVLFSTGQFTDNFTQIFVFSFLSTHFFLKSSFIFIDGGFRYDVFLFWLIGSLRACDGYLKSLIFKSFQEHSLSIFSPTVSFRIVLLWFKVFL